MGGPARGPARDASIEERHGGNLYEFRGPAERRRLRRIRARVRARKLDEKRARFEARYGDRWARAVSFAFAHRALAAFLALCVRWYGVIAAARAWPPLAAPPCARTGARRGTPAR